MVFKPGQSGNPSGRPKSKLFKETLIEALKLANGKKSKLEALANALIDKGITGDVPAIKEIADRIDGKVTQLIAGDEDESPLLIATDADRVRAVAALMARAGTKKTT